jgi:hypothetical protein
MVVRVLAGSMAPDRHRVLRQAFVALALLSVWAFLGRAWAASEAYRPGVTIGLEVRTPQGDLRSFQQPGHAPSYWTPDLPVVKGDQLTIVPLVTTGGAELGELTVRLDHSALAAPVGPDCRVLVDTGRLAPGYHLVEVWAATKAPKRGENSAATTFLLVPGADPLLQMLHGEAAAGPPVSDEERLAVAIRSPDEHVDEELTTTSSATIRAQAQLSISAGPAVKEYFYTLSRDGVVTYTSPRLPIETLVVIAPQAGDNVGLTPGKVTFTARGGDGAGRFGAPAWVTLDIVSPEAPK